MAWALLALLASLSWAIVQLVDKVLLASEAPSTRVYWTMTGVASLIPVCFLPLFVRGLAIPHSVMFIAILFAGICYFAANAFFFRAVSLIDSSITSAALAAIPALTTVGSWFTTKEGFGIYPVLGIVAITTGIIVMALAPTGTARSKNLTRKAFTYLALSELVFVMEYLIEGTAAKTFPALSVFYWTRIGVLCCVVFILAIRPKLMLKSLRWAFVESRRSGAAMLLNECLDMAAILLLITAYRRGPVGLSTALAYTQSAFVFIITIIVNRFRPGAIPTQGDKPGTLTWRVVGLCIVLSGVLASTLRSEAFHLQSKSRPTAQAREAVPHNVAPEPANGSRATPAPLHSESSEKPTVKSRRLTLEQWGQIAVIITMLILALQTRALRLQISRTDLQSIYNRYLDLTKIEVQEPTLHKMFFYGKDFDRLSSLTPEQLHERALSLLIFDQFALLYNMSKQPLWSSISRSALRRIPFLWRANSCQKFFDRHRTVWEINAEYVTSVLTNPLLIRSWTEWGLGETWRGSQFYEFVNQTIEAWEKEQREVARKHIDPQGSTEC